MNDARAKKFNYVLFKSISRFARDIQDGINMKRELDALGIGMIFIEQNIDTKTSSGELIFSIHLSIAQQESEQTSNRVKFGKREKVDRKSYQCGKYGKYGREFCSHHFIKADKLLSNVLMVLKELTEEGINKSKLIEVAKKEAGQHVVSYEKELKVLKNGYNS